MNKRLLFLAILFGLIPPSTLLAQTNVFGGVTFPNGISSFADRVISYEPTFGGGVSPLDPTHANPASALGAPDKATNPNGAVSIGHGGRIVLEFSNNFLTGSGNANHDLHVFEIGSAVEDTFVEISKDGTNWTSVGKVFGGTDSIDIDAFGFGTNDLFKFVRLLDDVNENPGSDNTPGADIDAVGAIRTVSFPHSPLINLDIAVVLKFQSFLGSTYQVQYSPDLVNWTNIGAPVAGTGEEITRTYDTTGGRSYRALSLP